MTCLGEEVRCLASFGDYHAETRYVGKTFCPVFDQTLGVYDRRSVWYPDRSTHAEFPIDNSCLSLLCVSAVKMNDPDYHEHLQENSAGPANSPDSWTRLVDTPLRVSKRTLACCCFELSCGQFQFFDYSYATPVFLGEFSVSPNEITALIQNGRKGAFYVRNFNGKVGARRRRIS
eukprot:766275-Hanusia_phi.AAC.2